MYSDDLINHNKFVLSSRETDIAACLLNQLPTKKISSLLDLSPSTIETHIRSIMIKTGCHSRKLLTEVINTLDNVQQIQSHFSSLLLESDFKSELTSFSKNNTNIKCILFYHDPLKKEVALLKNLTKHLSTAGISITAKSWQPGKKLTFINNSIQIQKHKQPFVVYLISNSLASLVQDKQYNIKLEVHEITSQLKRESILFVFTQESDLNFQDYKNVFLNVEKNYYKSVLSILQFFSPLHKFHKSLDHYIIQYSALFASDTKRENSHPPLQVSLKKKPYKFTTFAIFVFIIVTCSMYIIYLSSKKNQLTSQLNKSAPNHQTINSNFLLNLPARNSKFVGRNKELSQIKAFLNKYKFGVITQTISGLGGVGKTQLAMNYAYNSIEDNTYDTVLWIRAETNDSITSSYSEFSRSLKIDTKGYQAKDIQHLVHSELTRTTAKNFLFVLDNATPSKHIADYLENLSKDFSGPSKMHVLITSRSQKWHQDKLLLNAFSEQEAFTFIKKNLPNETDYAIRALAEKLHYFPLALDQAIKYIQEHSNINTYIELLDSNNSNHKSENDYTHALWSTWDLGFSKLSSNAKSILVLSSYLDADKINLDYFRDHSLKERDSAIAELKNYSFVTINNDGNSFRIHRLLQQIVREKKGSPKALSETVNLLNFSFSIYQKVNKEACDDLMPHVLSLAQHEMETPSLFYNGLALYIQATMYSTYVQEDLQQSKDRWAKILFLSTKRLSSEQGFSYLLASINSHIGFNNYVIGNLKNAQNTLKIANNIYDKPLTPISNHIEALLDVLRWSKNMTIRDGILADRAFTINGLATTEFDLNEFILSEKHYNKALEIINQCQEKDKINVYLITYLQNLLRFYIYTGRLEKASLIANNLNQTYDPDTSRLSQSYSYERIGELLLFQEDYTAAEKLFRQALEIKYNSYAKDNYRIGKALTRLGLSLTLMNKPKFALNYLEKAKKIYQKHFSESNINNLYLYFLLHYAFEKNLDFRTSTQYLDHLYQVIQTSQNSDAHILISKQIPMIEDFGKLRATMPDKTYLEQSLSLINKIFGENNLYISKYHYMLGLLFQDSSQSEAAHNHFDSALKIIKNYEIT